MRPSAPVADSTRLSAFGDWRPLAVAIETTSGEDSYASAHASTLPDRRRLRDEFRMSCDTFVTFAATTAASAATTRLTWLLHSKTSRARNAMAKR
jgi:hypothetical protein